MCVHECVVVAVVGCGLSDGEWCRGEMECCLWGVNRIAPLDFASRFGLRLLGFGVGVSYCGVTPEQWLFPEN